jgi:hypothetical protein
MHSICSNARAGGEARRKGPHTVESMAGGVIGAPWPRMAGAGPSMPYAQRRARRGRGRRAPSPQRGARAGRPPAPGRRPPSAAGAAPSGWPAAQPPWRRLGRGSGMYLQPRWPGAAGGGQGIAPRTRTGGAGMRDDGAIPTRARAPSQSSQTAGRQPRGAVRCGQARAMPPLARGAPGAASGACAAAALALPAGAHAARGSCVQSSCSGPAASHGCCHLYALGALSPPPLPHAPLFPACCRRAASHSTPAGGCTA